MAKKQKLELTQIGRASRPEADLVDCDVRGLLDYASDKNEDQ